MDELNKALTTATSSGAALLPEDLEPAIVEYLGRQMPLFSMLPKRTATSKTHEYTVRTAVPDAWFEGELTPANAAASSYERRSVQLKIARVWGGVSGFQQRMSEQFVNALATEIEGSVEGLAELMEYAVLWGNDTDTKQYDGIEAFIINDSTAQKTIGNGGNVNDVNGVITLSDLDDMLDAVETGRGTTNDNKVIIASPQMISKITGLQTKIQRTVQQIEFEGGFRMATYRGIPMVPSGFVRPAGTTTSPDVTATAAAGGSLADDTYYYRIASVTRYGEQLVGGEDSATTATTNNSVALSWTADSNAVLYKIYRGTTAGADNLELLDVIAAKSYDSAGTVSGNVTSYTDDGTKTPVSSVKPLDPVSSVVEETLFVVNLDPRRGAHLVGNMSPLGERLDTFVSYVPLAVTRSSFDYMIESFHALVVPQPTLHAVARRVRVA